MPIQENNIVLIIVIITIIFLVAALFMLFYVVIFIERKKRHVEEKQKMQQSFEQLLNQSQLEIQEQTFNEISQEIHDNVGQILSLAKVQLNIVEEQLQDAPVLLKESKNNISRAMTDLRDIAKSLSTDRIEKLSLIQAITQETEQLNKTNTFICSLEMKGEERNLDAKKKLIAFRIIQESLNNVLKHANATEIKIVFDYTKENLIITVKDNGKGVNIATAKNSGLGLQNIIKRTALIGGIATINSESNKGTIITLNIPYA